MASPKIFQRCPLVSCELRPMLSIGPVCSMTQAGVATNHIMASMIAGKKKADSGKSFANRHDDG